MKSGGGTQSALSGKVVASVGLLSKGGTARPSGTAVAFTQDGGKFLGSFRGVTSGFRRK